MLFPPMPIQRLSGQAVTIEDISLEGCRIPDGMDLGQLLAAVGRLHQGGLRRVSVAPLPSHVTKGFTWRAWESSPDPARISTPVDSIAAGRDAIAARPDVIALRIRADDRQKSLDEMLEVMEAIPPDIAVSVWIEAAFGKAGSRAESEAAIDICDLFAANGAQELILSDTGGQAGPLLVEQGCDGLRERWQGKHVVLELSDTYGMASANIIAAMAAGIDQFRFPVAQRDSAGHLGYATLLRVLSAMECPTGIHADRLRGQW
ncbi:hypothetical protein Tamer19_22290 [Cupriavidus sp. TA19]|uniref:hypothetical protein n=1 Tax=Cupriavidus sp. TA19 TaxID=701108 RepID=UPI0027294C64|nr:hypothetical protein [Cupriavidus sp. TA19]GLC92821.1 hypothetical protein Tamer19_22290 [Cupriavidus sp. TA19]